MAGKSSIEWTGHTWNPIAGCSVKSPGCKHCYAMPMAARLEAMGQELYKGLTTPSKAGPVFNGTVRQAADHVLLAPLKRKKPTTYFVNSMSDLFHENVSDEWIDRIFAVMALTPQHTYQVLTKRAERMRAYFLDGASNRAGVVLGRAWSDLGSPALRNYDHGGIHHRPWPLPNVWLGVSTERQQEADERTPHLLQTPAAVRFISAEPLLGPINLLGINHNSNYWDALRGNRQPLTNGEFGAHFHAPARLDWVIVGGESGKDARPMHPQWARDLRDQCKAAGVPFFFKQWGGWAPQFDECGGQHPAVTSATTVHNFMRTEHFGTGMVAVGKKAAGRLLDGIEHNAMPWRPA